jgi:hypothetical protein
MITREHRAIVERATAAEVAATEAKIDERLGVLPDRYGGGELETIARNAQGARRACRVGS